MKVIVAKLFHEGNTFSDSCTLFQDFSPVIGNAALNQIAGDGATSGIIKTLQKRGVEVVPTFFGNAQASAAVVFSDYQRIKDMFLSSVAQAGAVDGVCLALHGSSCVDGEDDPEGDILAALREMLGPGPPIVASLDMHSIVTKRMVEAADALIGYQTAPHTDVFLTGSKVADLTYRVLKENLRLYMDCVQIPMLLSSEQAETSLSPLRELIGEVHLIERQPGILSASYLLGFPWADLRENAVTAIVVGEKKAERAVQEGARTLAQKFWDQRRKFTFVMGAYPIEKALETAVKSDLSPTIIADSGDNPMAGASQDLSVALHAMLEKKVKDALVVFIVDPVSYDDCVRCGEGAIVNLELGKSEYSRSAKGLSVTATVLRFGFSHGINCAVVDINGVVTVIGDKRNPPMLVSASAVQDPAFVQNLGLSLKDFKIIVLKSGYLSKDYREIAAQTMLALTPGDTNEVFSELQFKQLPRPIFPLDQDMEWSAAED